MSRESYKASTFTGDFSLLPFRAGFLYGPIPTHPTANDFQSAAVRVAGDDDAAAIFYLEAIRERRLHPGIALDDEAIRVINRRVAARLYEIATE